MSIEEANVIDFVSIDLDGNVILTISDHLEWDDNNHHVMALQEKINAYLSAIEGTAFYETYPDAQGRKMKIHILFKYLPNEGGKDFLERVEGFLKEAGYGFSYKQL